MQMIEIHLKVVVKENPREKLNIPENIIKNIKKLTKKVKLNIEEI